MHNVVESFEAKCPPDTMKKLLDTGIMDDVQKFVDIVEGGIPSTKHNYGAYYRLLSRCDDELKKMFIIYCLIKCGANENGVRAAANLVFDN